MEEMTQEDIQASVSAAFDSVNLLASETDADTIDRNIQHLEIMMAKDWFVDALTEEQAATIQTVIS